VRLTNSSLCARGTTLAPELWSPEAFPHPQLREWGPVLALVLLGVLLERATRGATTERESDAMADMVVTASVAVTGKR